MHIFELILFLFLCPNYFVFTDSIYVTKSNGQHSKRASDEIVDITDDDDVANEEDDDEDDR